MKYKHVARIYCVVAADTSSHSETTGPHIAPDSSDVTAAADGRPTSKDK